ncbi:MAG: tetratricopeptide repeat protein [Candidatus Omnitrophica bacterium]|nr:tetratricopeptide repeat protein [Candidatus Omnitrophota bacterium]
MPKENIFIICIFICLIIIYLPSFSSNFIFDDNHMIVENAIIKNPKSLHLLFKGFVTSFPIPKGMCRPLLMLTFALNYATSKLNPLGYHLTNLILHFLNTSILYLLFKKLIKGIPLYILFFVTSIFAIHPLNSEAVTYISCRSDLMVNSFILLSFLFYLKNIYALTILFYIFALGSKETALCLPIILASYEFIYNFKNFNSIKDIIKTKKIFYISLFTITFIYLLYKLTIFAPTPTTVYRSAYSNILIQAWVSLLYLKLFLFPHPLNILHEVPNLNSLSEPSAFISILFILATIIIIILTKRKQKLISFGLSWFLICLLPKFYARLHFPACEHHFYLASIGIFILLLYLSYRLFINHPKLLHYLAIIILPLFFTLTFLRNYEYTNPIVFWKISVERAPNLGTLHNNLGTEYLRIGLYSYAEEEFKKAIQFAHNMKETIASAKLNLANVYISQNKYEEAQKLIEDCLRIIYPPPLGAYQTLGVIYMKMGKEDLALDAWEKELRYYPNLPEINLNLGIFYLNKKDFEKAKNFFIRAIKIDPNHYAGYYGLARISEDENELNYALAMYKKACSLRPNDFYLNYYLGSLYARLGYAKALSYLLKTIKLNPYFAPAHNDLAVLYASQSPPQRELAKKHAQIALSLGYPVDKDFLQLLENNFNR